MAYFKCPKCKYVFFRDLRKVGNKEFLTKDGNYRSTCDDDDKTRVCKRVNKKEQS